MGLVTIIYKSGVKVTQDVENLVCHTQGGDLVRVEYTNFKVRPLYLNVAEIESIWNGKV